MAEKSYTSAISDTPLLGDTIGENLDRTVARYPDHLALVDVPTGLRLQVNVLESPWLAEGFAGLYIILPTAGVGVRREFVVVRGESEAAPGFGYDDAVGGVVKVVADLDGQVGADVADVVGEGGDVLGALVGDAGDAVVVDDDVGGGGSFFGKSTSTTLANNVFQIGTAPNTGFGPGTLQGLVSWGVPSLTANGNAFIDNNYVWTNNVTLINIPS